MFNRSEILLKAWADYRRDQRMGLGVRRDGPFCRRHFAYCLRMAWAVTKEIVAKAAAEVEPYLGLTATVVVGAVNLLDAVTAKRVADLRNEMLWQQMGERIDWTAYRAASHELAQLTA